MSDLKSYVGAPDTDIDFVDECMAQANLLVLRFLGVAVESTPVEVVERATLEVGSELYHRRQAPNGIAQFNTFDGSAIRVARDPMVGAYPLLTPYMVGVA